MKLEYPLFSAIQKSVESLYQDGWPPHHLDSARSLEYDPNGSDFYVTTHEEFAKLKATQIQEIFRHRHIIIPGRPLEDFKFDRDGLKAVGSLTARRQIQGMFCSSPEQINSSHRLQ